MEEKVNIQNKIKLDRYIVESLNLNFDLESTDDISDDLDISLKVSSAFNEKLSKNYTIKFDLELKSDSNNFVLDCTMIGYFSTTNDINESFMDSAFVNINSPAILFPFLRSYINTITTNSGLKPLILPAINFTK